VEFTNNENALFIFPFYICAFANSGKQELSNKEKTEQNNRE